MQNPRLWNVRSKPIDWKQTLVEIGARKVGPVWRLASGRYSDIEYDIWRLYENPDLYSQACRALLKKAKIGVLDRTKWFIGLERDGIPLSLELARQTGASAGFASKTTFGAELKEFKLPPESKVYLVVDVHTAGTTLVKTCGAVELCGGEILDPVFAIVNRSGANTALLWPHARNPGYFHSRNIVSLVETEEPGWLQTESGAPIAHVRV